MLKDVLERSPVFVLSSVFFFGLTISAGTIKAILEFANQDIVPRGSYTLDEKIAERYVTIQEYKRIEQLWALGITLSDKDSVRQLYALKLGFEGMEASVDAARDKKCSPGYTCNYISSAGIKLYNSLAAKYNKIFHDSTLFLFPEDTTPNMVSHPEPLEVMSQIKLALTLLAGRLKC